MIFFGISPNERPNLKFRFRRILFCLEKSYVPNVTRPETAVFPQNVEDMCLLYTEYIFWVLLSVLDCRIANRIQQFGHLALSRSLALYFICRPVVR